MIKLGINVLGAGTYDSAKVRPGETESLPRVVTFYELGMFLKEGGVAVINGQEYPLKKGCVMLRRPGDVVWFKLHFLSDFVHFTLEEPSMQPLLDALPTCFYPERFEEQRKTLCSVIDTRKSADSLAPIAASGAVMQLLWDLHMDVTEPVVAQPRNPVRKAITMIRKAYDEQLSVEQLAKVCNLSVSHFHKLFVKTTGTTPNRYLMLCRLNAAKTLLQTSSCSVAQIAESCGFASQGYFCDCMKKYTGMSPRQFRAAKLEQI